MLNASPNPQTPQQQQPGNRMGTIMSGGIAGVASKAAGHSIKLVNDQDDYSLWEFYYDMSKEANAALAAAQNGGSRMGNTGATNPSGSTFGPSNTFGPSSTFGSSNSAGPSKGFSLSNDNSTADPGTTPTRRLPSQDAQPTPNQ